MYVHQALAHWAQRSPLATALVDPQRSYTYAELHAAAIQVATRLLARAGSDAPLNRSVAVCIRKGPLAVAALYGVLLAGGSYVPIDADLPGERVDHLLRETGSLCLLVDEAEEAGPHAAVWPELARVRVGSGLLRTPAVAPVHLAPCSDGDPAAVLFTSGSTGLPKGAVITHGNLRAFVDWAADEFALGADDRLASHASLSFDLSFFDLFAAVRVGASTALVPPASAGNGALLADFIQRQRPTIWQSVPSALGLLQAHMQSAGVPENALRLVLFAGERMPVPRLTRLLAAFSEAEFVNIYGCTETNDSFFYRVPRRGTPLPDPLPIGQAVAGFDYRLLNGAGEPVTHGEPGVLWVAGPTVMAGYLQAGHNEQVFREWPDGQGRLRRFYCTRDQAIEHADGDLRFLGRTDGVVKVGGFRVSLQEIEDHLAQKSGVDEAAVLAVPDDQLGHRAVAVIRLQPGVNLNTLDMKLHCAQRLPRYMVPQAFTFVTGLLPKSKNGKVDKRALAAEIAASSTTHPGNP